MVTLIIFLIDQVFLITLPDGDSQKTLTAPKGTRSDEYLPEQYGHQDIKILKTEMKQNILSPHSLALTAVHSHGNLFFNICLQYNMSQI